MSTKNRLVRLAVIAAGVLFISSGLALAGSHTWVFNEIFSNASGTIQFIELRESMGGNGEIFVPGHHITTSTPPAHDFNIPPPNLPSTTGFKTLLFATPACAALPGFPTPDYTLNAAPFFSVVNDTIACTGWPNFVYGSGGLPTDGVHSRNAGGIITCNTPKNYAGVTATLNIGCTTPGDVDGSGILDGNDIAGFVRVSLGSPIGGDNAACAEYCTGSLSSNVDAFVTDLLN